MAAQHKAEAVKALHEIVNILELPEPIDGLTRALLVARAVYAANEVAQIEELKRARRAQTAKLDGPAE